MSEYNIQMNKYNALNAEYDQLYPQPMKHASTHAKDGDDPITPSSIGAAELGADGKVLILQYERTGINQADISKLENGTRNPSVGLLKRLADGMGMALKIEFVPKQKV